MCLCVSGGTTLIVDVKSYTDMEVLGGTRDDAAGECFDKVARVLGMPYPGGAALDRRAQQGNPDRYPLPGPAPGKPPGHVVFRSENGCDQPHS